MDGLWLGHNQRVGAKRLQVQNENYYYFDAMIEDLISYLTTSVSSNCLELVTYFVPTSPNSWIVLGSATTREEVL